MTYWEPWLMQNGRRVEKLQLGRTFANKEEITDFFTYMHKTHPELVGEHIEFEEILDKKP